MQRNWNIIYSCYCLSTYILFDSMIQSNLRILTDENKMLLKLHVIHVVYVPISLQLQDHFSTVYSTDKYFYYSYLC